MFDFASRSFFVSTTLESGQTNVHHLKPGRKKEMESFRPTLTVTCYRRFVKLATWSRDLSTVIIIIIITTSRWIFSEMSSDLFAFEYPRANWKTVIMLRSSDDNVYANLIRTKNKNGRSSTAKYSYNRATSASPTNALYRTGNSPFKCITRVTILHSTNDRHVFGFRTKRHAFSHYSAFLYNQNALYRGY